MVVDILLEANCIFKFHENIYNPQKYVNYTDNILHLIENSDDPRLEKSQKLCKRIKIRDIYRMVGQSLIMNKEFAKEIKE